MMNASTSGVDTVRNFPCNVLDVILGCLPWKDAVKTSILSKDWRYKWLTRQELDFNDEFFKSFRQDEAAKRFIYQVLLFHKRPILKFRLQGRSFTSCPDIDHWMHFLSKKNIQEFTLHVSFGNKYHSPHHLFTFQQLRSFFLCASNTCSSILNTPLRCSLPHTSKTLFSSDLLNSAFLFLKLLANLFYLTMRNAVTSGVDTISNLPCNVLDVILGCLPWKDAVKTSILSKDWRYKWLTRQELDFNDEFFKSFIQDEAAKRFIYQVLLFHRGPILKFKLHGRGFTSCPDIGHWMHFLSKKNVQEFTLHLSLGNKDHLPHHLFTFQQLRYLELQNCLFHPPLSFKGFEKLINLDLLFVTFVPSIFTNLISKSPLLERLRLSDCTNFDTLEIDAANLKFFEFIGKSKSISFKNAPMLEKVIVCFKRGRLLTDTSPVCSNFTKFFHYMPSLLELALSGPTLEYLMKRGLPESPPAALNNIKSLNISSMSLIDVEVVSSAVYLVTSCPKLHDLTIEFYPVGDDIVEPVVQLLRAQSFSYGALKLQRVHMNMFTGLEMEMEFMKFILATAPVLEEIKIWNFTDDLFRPGKQMIDEMEEFRRASPNVEFIFEEIELKDRVLYEPEEEVMEVP